MYATHTFQCVPLVVLVSSMTHSFSFATNSVGGVIQSQLDGNCLAVHVADDGKETVLLKSAGTCHAENYWHWQGNLLKAKRGRERCLTCVKGAATLGRCAGYFNQYWYIESEQLVCYNPEMFSDVSSNSCLVVSKCASGDCAVIATCNGTMSHRWNGSVVSQGPPAHRDSRLMLDVCTVVGVGIVCLCVGACLICQRSGCICGWYSHGADDDDGRKPASRSLAYLKNHHHVPRDDTKVVAGQLPPGRLQAVAGQKCDGDARVSTRGVGKPWSAKDGKTETVSAYSRLCKTTIDAEPPAVGRAISMASDCSSGSGEEIVVSNLKYGPSHSATPIVDGAYRRPAPVFVL
jgi:hypothetical protein